MVYYHHNRTYCNSNWNYRRHVLLNYRLKYRCKYRGYYSKYKYSRHLHCNIHNSSIWRLCSSYKNNNSYNNSATKCKYQL